LVVSNSEEYGHSLVKFNSIVTRPLEPDKLPQMKGKLDIPGQIKEVLRLDCFLAKFF